MLNWLVECYTEVENTDRIIVSIKKQGYKYVDKRAIPGYMDIDDYFKPNCCLISYCSIQTAGEILRKSWYPGVFTNFNEYKCSQFYPLLSKYLFNNDYLMLPYGELLRRKDFLYDTLGSNDCIFVRPNSGFKVFTGTIIEKERFEKDINRLGYGDIPKEEIVLIAYPRNINREWRFFATKEGVITGSLYRQSNQKTLSSTFPEDAKLLADEIAKSNIYFPDPIISIDICEDKNGDFYLLEIGCFSCSGMYDCDTDILVEVASKEAIKAYEEIFPTGESNES